MNIVEVIVWLDAVNSKAGRILEEARMAWAQYNCAIGSDGEMDHARFYAFCEAIAFLIPRDPHAIANAIKEDYRENKTYKEQVCREMAEMYSICHEISIEEAMSRLERREN